MDGTAVAAVFLVSIFLNLLMMYRNAESIRRGAKLFAIGSIVAAGVAFLSLADRQQRFDPGYAADLRRVYDQLYGAIREKALTVPQRPISVFIPLPEPIAPHAFLLRSLQDHTRLLLTDPGNLIHSTQINDIIIAARSADLIIVPDVALTNASFAFPVSKLLPGLRNEMGALGFSQIKSIPFREGAIVVYGR